MTCHWRVEARPGIKPGCMGGEAFRSQRVINAAQGGSPPHRSYVRQNVGERRGTFGSQLTAVDEGEAEQLSTPFGTRPPSGEGSYDEGQSCSQWELRPPTGVI